MESEFHERCGRIYAEYLEAIQTHDAPFGAFEPLIQQLAEAKRADVVRFPVLGHIVPKEFASFARLFHLHPIRTESALMREMTAFRTLTELLPCTTSLDYVVQLVLLGCCASKSICAGFLAGGKNMERAVWDVGSKVETWLRTAPARQAAELLAALGLQPDTNPSMPGVVFDLYRSLPDPDKAAIVLQHAAFVVDDPSSLLVATAALNQFVPGGVATLVPKSPTPRGAFSPAELSLEETVEILGPCFALAESGKTPGATNLTDVLKMLAERAGLGHLLRSIERWREMDQGVARLETQYGQILKHVKI